MRKPEVCLMLLPDGTLLRKAKEGDKEQILSLILAYKEEDLVYKDIPPDEEEILLNLDLYYKRLPKEGVIIVAEKEEALIGLIIGISTKLPFSKLLQATEPMWYVTKEHRKTNVGLALYNAFLYWANTIAGASVIHTGVQITGMESGLSKVFKKEGYSLLEELYVKVI